MRRKIAWTDARPQAASGGRRATDKRIIGAATGRGRTFLVTAASELRGLRRADVDLDQGAVHVPQRADRYNEIGRPKSESSRCGNGNWPVLKTLAWDGPRSSV
jgi:hypothetical protein